MSPDFHREYLVRLPLPLAQLYSRARNAKNARGQHDNTFYLFEALTKLAAAPAGPALVRQIEQGQGMLTERFALCQAMPLDQYLAVAEGLRVFGYRPTCFRPYAVGKAVQVAAVWLRDWRDWHLAYSATAAEIRKQDAQWQAKGYWPRDVAGYLGESGGKAVERYAVLWTDPEPGMAESRLYVGIADVEAAAQSLRKAGLIPHTQSYFSADGGQRHSGVWWKPERMPDMRWSYVGLEEAWYESLLFPINWQVDVRVDRAPAVAAPKQRYQDQLAPLDEFLRLNPDNLAARFARGFLYFCLAQDEKALADLDQVIAKAPQLPESYLWRALARARLGRASEARQDLVEFQNRSGEPGEKLSLDVALSAFLGDDAGGVKRLEAALAERPGHSYYRYYAAGAYAAVAQAVAAKRPDQARVYADRAVDLLRQVTDGGFIGDTAFTYRRLQTMWSMGGLWDHPRFQDLLRQGHLERQYAAVWYENDDLASAESHGLDPADHVRRCRELAAGGYRPASLSAAWLGEGQPLATASVWHRPVVPEARQEARARRQAQAAVALLQLGEPGHVWPLLRHSDDPRVRSYLIHRFSPLGLHPQTLIDRLKEEPDVSARRALLLSLGEFPNDQLPAEARAPLVPGLLQDYRDDPDPGLHAAADWLLRRWGQAEKLREIDRGQLRQDPDEARRWYANKQGQTLAVIRGPVEFWMGSPAGEPDRENNERLHRERIPRSFAIAATEVTMSQFQRFLHDHPEVQPSVTSKFSPDAAGAAIDVTWCEAAQYCNWLSDTEGIPKDQWCYPPIEQVENAKKYRLALQLPADYLHRTGYRLPTQAEWECASRAGATTSRFYGAARELLGHYARYVANSDDRAWAVGRLKPNDFGLFDVYGNVWEWCQDHWSGFSERGPKGQPHEDWESTSAILPFNEKREMRGGSFLDPAARLRSAYHNSDVMTHISRDMGFRVARTVR